MTIQATCPKGHTLTLEEKLAGKKIRCPRCQVVFQVPDLDDEEIEEAEAVSEKPIRRAQRRDDDDDDEEDERPRRKARAPVRDDDDDEDDDDDRPRGRARAAVRDDDDEDDDEEEEMDDETRRKLERKLKKKQLKLVDVGLLMHYIKLCMYIVGIVLAMTVGILMAIAGAQAAEAVEAAPKGGGGGAVGGVQGFMFMGYAILVLLAFLLNLVISLLAPLCGVVGSFLCCFVPKKSEAKGTIITSLTFDLVSLVAWVLNLLAITGVLGMEATKRDNMTFLLQLISMICTVVSWLTFLTFLRSLGVYLGEAALGNEALNLIARLVVQVITLILDFMIIVAFGRYFVGVFIAIFIAIGAMTIWFIFFIFTFYLRQLKLVSAMRLAVQNKL